MTVNELRLGNLVKYNGKVIIVDTIYYDIINMDLSNNDGIEVDLIKPIPLTEEILLKCGFVKTFEGGTLWYLDDFFVASLDFIYWSGIKIKYLHQLQNLYFALTNNELEINL